MAETKQQGHQKPWMQRRLGESVREWNERTNHTCYSCGQQDEDLAQLDEHEAAHTR